MQQINTHARTSTHKTPPSQRINTPPRCSGHSGDEQCIQDKVDIKVIVKQLDNTLDPGSARRNVITEELQGRQFHEGSKFTKQRTDYYNG